MYIFNCEASENHYAVELAVKKLVNVIVKIETETLALKTNIDKSELKVKPETETKARLTQHRP